jgi:hypothetical protein
VCPERRDSSAARSFCSFVRRWLAGSGRQVAYGLRKSIAGKKEFDVNIQTLKYSEEQIQIRNPH